MVYHENVVGIPWKTVVYMVVSGRCMCLYAVVLHVVAVFVSWMLVMVGRACL